jgi:hypothetical protein
MSVANATIKRCGVKRCGGAPLCHRVVLTLLRKLGGAGGEVANERYTNENTVSEMKRREFTTTFGTGILDM